MGWKDTLVTIWTPTKDAKGETGTGFPIAQDLVMTARHVVRPEGRDEKKPIEINWWYSKESWKELSLKEKEAIIWECNVHDAAVLKVPRPADVDGLCFLSPLHPQENTRWSSAGFSRADKKNGGREPGNFCGEVMSMAEKARRFEVSASETSPSTEEGWKGASGMPIVVRERVIGVGCETHYSGKKIRAAPICQLWREMDCHRSIRDVLPSFDLVGQIRSKLTEVIRSIQLSDQEVEYIFDRIAEQSGALTEIPKGSHDDRAIALVDAISDLTPAQAFEAFGSHTLNLGHGMDNKISEFVQSIAPYLFAVNGTEVSDIVEKAGPGGALVIGVPIATHTMAEILVAAAQKRSVNFAPRRNEQDLPAGAKVIPFYPLLRNGDKTTIDAHIIEELSYQYPDLGSPSGHKFETAIEGFLANDYRVTSSNNHLKAVRIRMEIDKKRGSPIPYMAFFISDNEYERKIILSSVRSVCRELPDLTIIILDRKFFESDLLALSFFPYFVPLRPSDI